MSPVDPLPQIGHVGMVQRCARVGSEWTLGSFTLLRGWSKQWNRLPGKVVDAPSLSMFKRHLDNAPNNMLELGQAVGLDDCCRSLPTETVYSKIVYSKIVYSIFRFLFYRAPT